MRAHEKSAEVRRGVRSWEALKWGVTVWNIKVHVHHTHIFTYATLKPIHECRRCLHPPPPHSRQTAPPRCAKARRSGAILCPCPPSLRLLAGPSFL